MSITELIKFLVYLIIGGAIVYAVYEFISLLTIPAPIKNLILLIVAIVALVFLLSFFFPGIVSLH